MEKNLERKIQFKDASFQLSVGSAGMNMNSSIPENGVYEPWLTKYLEIASDFYGTNKDAIDIGANIGIISLILSSLQSEGTVLALEPLSIMYKHLLSNIERNNTHNIITEKAILSNIDNELKSINVPYSGAVGGSFVADEQDVRLSAHSEEVMSITLDSYLEKYDKNLDIKIIKIDVECWEKFVLQGAHQTLKKHQPIVIIEFNVDNRLVEIEKRGFELYQEIKSLFKHIFLIDRLSNKLVPITTYSELRGAMLTGHFVEDLMCFNDNDFLAHLKPHIIQNVYTSYHAAKITETKNKNSLITSLSHYPDNWCHGHNFFLYMKSSGPTELRLTFHNTGPFPINRILVAKNNEFQEITLEKESVSVDYIFSGDTSASIYLFVEKTFLAKEHINTNDPRELGIQLKIEEIETNRDYIVNDTSVVKMHPVSKLIHAMHNQPVKVLWKKSFWAEYNAKFDTFYSFCQLGEKFISLHGEMNIETFHKRREKQSTVAKLYKCEYEISTNGLIQTSKKYIGLGADPRMVSDGKNAYAYVIGYGEAKHPAFLYVEKEETLHPIKADDNFDWGKNWQPFLKEGRLFFVHELTPYSIYEIDLNTYQLERRHFVNSNLCLPAHFTNHTMFRGGANAIAEDGITYGLGRASAQPYKHLPFIWSSAQNEFPTIQFTDFFNKINDKGFNILDPTSFFKTKENIFIGLACSETCWFHPQNFSNLLLVIDVENKYNNLPSLDSVLASYEDTYIGQRPNLKQHIFHCDRMQHDMAYSYEYGVKSTSTQGVLVYGPYLTIEEGLHLTVELSYLTMQEEGSKAGVFDICLSKEKENGEVEFINLTACALKATGKEIDKAILFLDTHQFIGYKVEFRVTVEEGYELNAFHIRTTEIIPAIPCHSLPAAIEVNNSNGIRSSQGQKGFLFFGPYQDVKDEGTFEATLYYKADASKNNEVGTFDIAVSSPKGDVIILAKMDVLGTENIWESVRLSFSLNNYLGYKLETRLNINNNVQVSASYISIDIESIDKF